MGWIKDAKAGIVREEAGKARAAGRAVFAAKLNYPGAKADFSGEIVDWSLMIEAIEAEGWALYNFAAMADTKGRPEALCLFRPRQ